MSWLSGLANKAEEMLNKVDASAAQALQNEDEDNLSPSSHTWDHSHSNGVTKETNYDKPTSSVQTSGITSSASVPSNMNQMNSENNYTTQMSKSMYAGSQIGNSPKAPTIPSNSSKKGNKKDQDEELFEFLNNPEVKESKKDRTKVLATNGKHSRQSSTSSNTSAKSRTKTPDPNLSTGNGNSEETVVLMPDKTDSGKNSPDHFTSDTHADHDVLGLNDSSSGYHSNQEDNIAQQNVSSLELENRLLKNEVSSLNQEMSSVIKRAKEAQEGMQNLKQKLSSQNQHLANSDQIIRELRAREGDLTEAMNAKDSQLAILRVRFEEADKELSGKKKQLEDVEVEKKRILQDHTSSSGVHGQALETLKSKLVETEGRLRVEQESMQKFQQESMERISKTETEQQNLSSSLTKVQKSLQAEKAKSTELQSHIKSSKTAAERAKQELEQYKDKAARILQSKDKLISSLKEGTAYNGTENMVSNAELEEARQEKDLMREELQHSKMAVENLRQEIQDLEQQIETDVDAARDQIDALEEKYENEKRTRVEGDDEIKKQKQELTYAHEEILRQKTAFQSRLQDREMEIEKLRQQLTTKSLSTSSEEELNNRLHALTESLIHKQTLVEALSSEKNSLVLQLERLETQYRDVQACAVRVSSTAVRMNEDDESRQRLPSFLRETPLDGEAVRKVKRAAGSIDKFSIRLGVFLRRYPIARVFVILYMVLLHVWVMVVLLTYQPEMHGADFHPHPPES